MYVNYTVVVQRKSNFAFNIKHSLLVDTWYNIFVTQQKYENDDYIFRVYVNNIELISIENENVQEFGNVTVWLSSPKLPSANVKVRNLYYGNLE